jgi:hypothetical protein
MGIRNFLNRRNPSAVAPTAAAVAGPVHGACGSLAVVEQTTGQLTDLEAARAELLQLAAEVG